MLMLIIYNISRDGSKNFNIRTCEHMILGQLRMGARQAKNAPLLLDGTGIGPEYILNIHDYLLSINYMHYLHTGLHFLLDVLLS